MTLSCGQATAAARRRHRPATQVPRSRLTSVKCVADSPRWTDAPLVGAPGSGYCVGVDESAAWAPAGLAALNLNAPVETETATMADPSCTPYTIPVTDHNRGISGKDASFLGDISNASDRANQDRYLASEFRGLHVSGAERGERHALSAVGDARWLCDKFDGIAKDVERNGRSAELATEKTAAATILAIEKAAAAAALCCCEMKGAVAASTSAILSKMCEDQTDELRRQLTVYQVRAVAGTGSSPV